MLTTAGPLANGSATWESGLRFSGVRGDASRDGEAAFGLVARDL